MVYLYSFVKKSITKWQNNRIHINQKENIHSSKLEEPSAAYVSADLQGHLSGYCF